MTSGLIVAVSPRLIGDTLSADVAAGALVLPVDDAGEFDEEFDEPRFVVVGDTLTPLQYVGVVNDDDAPQQSLTLAAPLPFAAEAGLPVTVWDPTVEGDEKRGVEFVAQVRLDDQDDATIPATIDHTLVPLAGVYSLEGAQVSLDDDEGEWFVARVLGRPAVVAPDALDRTRLTEIIEEDAPDGGGVVTDGQPPASTPTPVVRGAVKGVVVTLPEVVNADPVTVELWASLSSPVDTSGAPLLSVTAPGQSIQFIREVGGVELDPTMTVYVVTRARDADDVGPFSAEASGSPALINSTDVVANFITANLLVANEALINALQVVDLSALTFTSPVINGGSINIASTVAASIAEQFSGTTMPSGWTSTRTGPFGSGAAGTGIPGASVVSSGPAGQSGSALLIDYGTSGADAGLAANQASGEVTTTISSASTVDIATRYRTAVRSDSFFDPESLHLVARSADGAAYSGTWDAITLDLIPDYAGADYEYVVSAWLNGSDTRLGVVRTPYGPHATWHRARLRVGAGQVQAKVWRDGDLEPAWTSFDQTLVGTPGRASVLWRAHVYLGGVLTGQRAWLDSLDITSYAAGLEVYKDGGGDWKPVLDPIRNAASAEATTRANADTALSNRIDAVTAATSVTVDAVAPFSGSLTFTKAAGMVTIAGSLTRPTGSSGAFTTCLTMPAAFAPLEYTGFPASVVFNSTVTYQFEVRTSGEMRVRMSGATALGLQANGFTWRAA